MKNVRSQCPALVLMLISGFCAVALCSENPNPSNERTFSKSKTAIEKVIKSLPSSGRLPVLDGFAIPGKLPLDRFQRGYYQCEIQVTPLPTGGSRVRVNAKITAWYADSVSAHSGYQTLPSNGRIEADLLDQIGEALGSESPANAKSERGTGLTSAPKSAAMPDASEPGISAPMPRIPESDLHGSPLAAKNGDTGESLKSQTDAAEKHEQELADQAKSLEEILQNQAHPNNLVAVKKTGTPVLQSPNADAKLLFPATAGDEFEILDINSNWVHVRISGLSRGWIRRSAVEMPEAFASAKTSGGSVHKDAVAEFRISNEQIAPFPGDWDPLRGKIVKIVTVQKANDAGNTVVAAERLQYAKRLFMKQYSALATSADAPAGVVIIFDSDDGGMIAATLPTLKEWRAGASDETTWRKCFFDPPELSGAGGSRSISSAQ